MEHRFCLDEILGKVSEMINDGYHYGSIDVLEDCLLDNGQHGAIMLGFFFCQVLFVCSLWLL